MSRSRKPAVRTDSSCGNHGGCPWCEGNRIHKRVEAERVGALEAADPFVVASNYQPHAAMAAAGVPFADSDDGYDCYWDDDWLDEPVTEPAAPLRVPLAAWSIESHLGALQDRIHPTSGRLIKATPLRLPRSRG